MFGFSVLFTALLPLLASAAPSGVGFTKRIDANAPVLEKKYDLNPWYTALRPMPTYTINRWTWTIPNKCYDEAIGNALKNGWTGRCTDVNKLSVFEVTYSDASKPWMFCRCTDSGESEADMIEKVGRIPAGIRQVCYFIIQGYYIFRDSELISNYCQFSILDTSWHLRVGRRTPESELLSLGRVTSLCTALRILEPIL